MERKRLQMNSGRLLQAPNRTQPRIPVAVTCRRCGHEDTVEPGGIGWDRCPRCGREWNTENRMWVKCAAEMEPRHPVYLYLWAIHRMLLEGSAYMQHCRHRESAELEYPRYGDRQPAAPLIGWFGNGSEDAEPYEECRYWYLIPRVTFRAVKRFYRATRSVFRVTSVEIKMLLDMRGLLFHDRGRVFGHVLADGLPLTLWMTNPF